MFTSMFTHLGVLQTEFWRRAKHNPELKGAQRLHLAAGEHALTGT